MNTILVVEDEGLIRDGLRDNLTFEGYSVLTAADGETGLRLVDERQPDLIILDLMLPRLSGYQFCRQLRAAGIGTPILILTARGEETDRVLGLDLGADDYMTKPFSIRELMARVRALLRRSHGESAVADKVSFGDVRIDFLAYEAFRGGRRVDLTRKEFAVLKALALRPGIVVTREELLKKVWGYEADLSTRTADNHIASLRAKLEEEGSNPRHLVTVHGVGYKLVLG
jgi:DNA-binding response OmpR family regulator